ncbi:hypothetical protein GJAV_G00101420 [Gymnothorax javanicus]|nr:hypothetical protein GJAV_G00101420 [Gymnothorax javanicus]
MSYAEALKRVQVEKEKHERNCWRRKLLSLDEYLSRSMEVAHSVRERTIAENSLVILLQGLRGQVTTVDLRDESIARGRVVNVDAFMNIRLEDVLYRDRRGQMSKLADLFITGRNVRYVHIPDDVDIMSTIEAQLKMISRVRNFGGKMVGRSEYGKYKK